MSGADRAAERVVGVYERNAEAWVAARLRESSLYERGWLDRFCALIPEGGSVLDIGCGAGVPIAHYLRGCGYEVTGVDSSAAMVAMFQERLSGQRVVRCDMRALALGQVFDGVLAWDSFFHLSPEDQRGMFPIFRAHVAARGALMFTSGPSHGEVVGELEGDPLYHASLDGEEYRKLLEGEGFEVVAMVAEDPSCWGRTVWLAQVG